MHIQKKQWKYIWQDIKNKSELLFYAIDDIATNDDLFYEVSYDYGEDILVNGKLTHSNLCIDLDYAAIPLSIIINNSAELYINNKIRDIPLDLLNEGNIFGTYEILDQMYNIKNNNIWSITSGVRSIFALQKLTELSKFKKLLQVYNLNSHDFPASYYQHFNLFKKISSDSSWKCKIIYIPKSIVQPVIEKQSSHKLLNDFITSYSWKAVNSSVEVMKNNLYWERLSLILSDYSIKIDQQYSETLKHLIQIHKAKAPGFRITTEKDAPINEISYALTEVYGCRYKVDLLSLANVNDIYQQSVYYSFLHPTILDGNVMLADNLRSYYSFCDKLAYIISIINREFKEKVLPVNVYSSKNGLKDCGVVKPIHKIKANLDLTSLASSKFFRAAAEIGIR